MARPRGLVVVAAFHVEEPHEARAREMVAGFLQGLGRPHRIVACAPYPKFPGQMRVTAWFELAPGAGAPEGVEAVCAALGAASGEGYRNVFANDDGSLVVNRILDARTEPLPPGVAWVDLEVNAHGAAQQDLHRALDG